MRKLTCVLAFAALAACLPALSGHGQQPKKAEAQKPEPKKVKELMRRKLENSQKLLEALALNDLDRAGRYAEELIRIRKEAEWRVVKTEQYEMWSDEFKQSAEAIVTAAKEKNLERAKLSYLSMTLSCFHCHSYARDVGIIRADRLDP